MNGTEIATVQNIEQAVVPIPSVVEQVAYIQKIMKTVMQEGQHYGKIPNTPKPSLWKPGAEKLLVSFRLDAEYEDLKSIERDDFILKEIKSTLYHIPTGMRVASGVGSANSREEKWRWKKTDELVPGPYWAAKKNNDTEKMRELLGGVGKPKKLPDGRWVILREREDVWDLHNTLTKMACKRALVAAVLNATAASDIFTQDLEDIQDVIASEQPQPEPPAEKKPAAKKPAAKRSATKKTTKGGANIPDYDKAVGLLKELKFGRESAVSFIENLGINIGDGESPLYDVVNQEQMEMIIDELIGMIDDAKAEELAPDDSTLPLESEETEV
jgi:hypothetical protein